MADLPLPGSFASFRALATGFLEVLPLGFLTAEGAGLPFLAGVLALGGAFLGSGLLPSLGSRDFTRRLSPSLLHGGRLPLGLGWCFLL